MTERLTPTELAIVRVLMQCPESMLYAETAGGLTFQQIAALGGTTRQAAHGLYQRAVLKLRRAAEWERIKQAKEGEDV